ncbi:hypothetical protein TNCV_3602731 [Trichonephila clavipes]|nr:hypothetical protein TNCV_3602731 [Trichonephila clavipes]
MSLSLMPRQTRCLEMLMVVKSVDDRSPPVEEVWKFGEGLMRVYYVSAQSPHVGVVWKFERKVHAQVSSSSLIQFKITRFIASSPRVALRSGH